jgi:hypothetical protein
MASNTRQEAVASARGLLSRRHLGRVIAAQCVTDLLGR